MTGKGQSAGSGDAGADLELPQLAAGFFQERGQGLLDVGVMALVIRELYMTAAVKDSDLYSGGTDIDPKTERLIHVSGEIPLSSLI